MKSNLTREEKIKLLRGVVNGTVSKDRFIVEKKPDMSWLTDEELRRVVGISERCFHGGYFHAEELSKEEDDFLEAVYKRAMQ